MLILLRSLPFAVGITNTLFFLLQSRNVESYPWFAVIASLLLFATAFLIVWKRGLGLADLRLIIPSVLAVVISGYALLLAEGIFALWVIPLFVGGLSFVSLELLFLSTFVSAWYPVNGLSHINLALVPITFWLIAFTSVGLTVFVNSSRLVPILTMTLVAFAMFYWTSHAEAGQVIRRRWAFIGGWIGFQLGLIGAVIPVNLIIHGTVAAVCGAFAVRTRRYGIAPPIPRKLIILETAGFFVFLAAILATARWV